jgi:Asp-tRNA(Asn)/Glu-tRNA(Gln) amidotransferase A subunit family amidase
MGARGYEGFRPPFDAGCVGLARAAGGVVLGKTVTCEFAGITPSATRNPRDPGATPGGSSSGSAAAVADFMVPFAFGTQTGGSVLRPAAFCGIVGFKPSFGVWPVSGMKPAAHSFDTVGVLARSVGDAALVHAALTGARAAVGAGGPPRIGLVRSHLDATLTPAAAAAVEAAAARLAAAGAEVVEVMAPPDFAAITAHRATVNAWERGRDMAGEWLADPGLLSPGLRALVEQGLATAAGEYAAARAAVEGFRARAAALFFGAAEILMLPTAPGEAPEGPGSTGDPRLQEMWTALHLPSLSLPFGTGPRGLPLGLQLVGPPLGDDRLLAAATWAEARLSG